MDAKIINIFKIL